MGYNYSMKAVMILAFVLLFGAGTWFVVRNIPSASPSPLLTDIPSDTMEPMAEPAAVLTLASDAFQNGGSIPAKFTCDGENISPALSWTGVPVGTRSLALLVDDPDIPKQLKADGTFDHWTLFNILPDVEGIPEGGSAGTVGANGAGKSAFMGSCPPRQYEPAEHRYFFRLYALDVILDLSEGATKKEVLAAMEGHVLQEAELVGRYRRP